MSSSAVKFLERKQVIQFFGFCLVVAPFVNAYLVLYTKMQDYKLTWAQINIINTLKSGILDNYILSLISIVIGIVMLRGSTKAWRAALFLVGFHIAIQVLNYNTSAKGNILWWPFLLVNVSVFMFIADQLVWKIEIPQVAPRPPGEPKVIHLKTFKKIYLRHEGPTPWAEIKNMNSKGFQAHCLQPPTEAIVANVAARNVVLKISNDLILQARLKSHTDKVYVFEFIQQAEKHDELINSWFKKIAV
jgi:hypothetical protein